MRSLLVLLAMLCFVSGRNLHESKENEDIGIEDFINNDAIKNLGEPGYNQMRHQRKRRQSFYGFSPYYHERDFSCRDEINILRNEILQERRNNNEMIIQIFKLVEEVIKRPQPPPQQPQIIYVPVPVTLFPYNLGNNSSKLSFNGRFWVWDTNEDTPAETDDGNDGSSPISYQPFKPDDSVPKPPPVEHGSSQAGMPSTTRRPAAKPNACQAAIIICCNFPDEKDQKECFENYNCNKTFRTGFSCSSQTIEAVLEAYKKNYAVKKN